MPPTAPGRRSITPRDPPDSTRGPGRRAPSALFTPYLNARKIELPGKFHLRFAHADGHRGDAVEREQVRGNRLRQRLDQVRWLPLHDGPHEFVGPAVVDRQLKGVTACRCLHIGLQLDVDEKLLALGALFGQHPMIGEKSHPREHQAVRHPRRLLTAASAPSRSASARRPSASARFALLVRIAGSLIACRLMRTFSNAPCTAACASSAATPTSLIALGLPVPAR